MHKKIPIYFGDAGNILQYPSQQCFVTEGQLLLIILRVILASPASVVSSISWRRSPTTLKDTKTFMNTLTLHEGEC